MTVFADFTGSHLFAPTYQKQLRLLVYSQAAPGERPHETTATVPWYEAACFRCHHLEMPLVKMLSFSPRVHSMPNSSGFLHILPYSHR
ncbi:UNVERIFIED_CONTAM: hypothetical protein HHA_451970 [Hammondia hammondi]|eukprot:XP_008884970.1 hypothetical protein HHA_451970 [Hammondia hammondi]